MRDLQELKEELDEVKKNLAVYEDRKDTLLETLKGEKVNTVEKAEKLKKQKTEEKGKLIQKQRKLIEKAEARLEKYE